VIISLEPDLFGSYEAERIAEMKRWMDEFAAWQDWARRWRGRPEPGSLRGYRDRRAKPTPPVWLEGRCATLSDEDDPLMPGCTQLAEWREENGLGQVRRTRAAAAQQQEEASKTTFWEHLQVDLLWPAVQWQSSIYGVVGMHMATTVAGRLQVFTAPGAMLLNMPARNGTRAWKVAANYGIGYRLLDFRFFGGRPAQLHLNLAKSWILSDITELVGGRSVDFAGFSVTFKKR
jgi:hypothetical protein